MASTFNFVGAIILLCAFYSLSITVYTHYLPTDAVGQIGMFNGLSNAFSVDTINQQVNAGMTSQTQIPTYDVGSLLFYSGNFVFDLFTNFATALPQMIGITFSVIFYFIHADPYLASVIEAGCIGLMAVFYGLALINMLIGARTGRIIT